MVCPMWLRSQRAPGQRVLCGVTGRSGVGAAIRTTCLEGFLVRSPRCPSRSQGLPTRCQSAFLATTGMLASLVSTVVLYVELVVCRVGAETRLGSWVMARRPTRLSRSTLLASPTQRRLQQAARSPVQFRDQGRSSAGDLAPGGSSASTTEMTTARLSR